MAPHQRIWTAALMLAIIAPAVRGDIVERRGAEPAIVGKVTLDDAVVRVQTESGAIHEIPWDRVRRIRSDDPAVERHRYADIAVDLWRARSRVERGDTTLAEPLLERLFERYRGRTNPTARVVAEGLLRCRLARGANALALIPALETARLERAGVRTDSYADLPLVIEPDTALCPRLAPAWIRSRALGRAERELAEYDAQGDGVIAAIGRLYLRGVRQSLGRAPSAAEGETPDSTIIGQHRGAGFLAILVECGSPDPNKRAAARTRAMKEIETAPRWAAGWVRFAVGESLLRESGIGRRQQGMVQLLHLPAEYRAHLPYLAGLALSRVAEVSRNSGDAATAHVLDEELARSFPNHPVRSASAPVTIPPA